MKEKTLKSSVLYTLGIILYAIWINLGSTIHNPMPRLQAPYTPLMMVLTAVLLLFYLCYLAFINQYVRYAWHGFRQWPVYHRFAAYLSLTALVLCLVHIALMFILLSQRKGGTDLFVRYFKLDFWIFSVPLFCYCICLYRYPQMALFGFSRVQKLQHDYDELHQRKLYIRNENKLLMCALQELEQSKLLLEQQAADILTDNVLLLEKEDEFRQRQRELVGQKQGLLNALSDLKEQKQQLLLQQQDLLDKQAELQVELEALRSDMEIGGTNARVAWIAWRDERRMPALLTYIRAQDQRTDRDTPKVLLIHDLLLCYRKDRCYFMMDRQGQKQIISDEVGKMLKGLDWFVQINGQIYINMLYCIGQLEKYGAEKNRSKVVLDSDTHRLLEQLMPQDELDELLESSRRCRKNFYCFWDSNNLRELDEKGLFLEFRTDLGRNKN